MPRRPAFVSTQNLMRLLSSGWHMLAATTVLFGSLADAEAAGPTLPEPVILVESRGASLHEPPPDDYIPYELLPRITDRKEFEFKLAPDDSWRITLDKNPLSVEVPRHDYRDVESGTPRLATSALDANNQRSIVGCRLLSTRPWGETGRVHTEGRTLWLCEFIQNTNAPSAFFAPGDTNIFVTQGLRYGSNWILLGGRVSWELTGGLKAFAAYDAQVNGMETFHIGSTGLGYTW
jgi:hypothetical protein